MQNISWETIAETPWWAYAIYLYFLWLAFLSTKAHTVPIKNLTYFSLLYLVIGLPSLCLQFGMPLLNLALLAASLLLAAPLGWFYCGLKKMRILAREGQVYMPPSWLSLPLILGLIGAYLYYHPTYFNLTSLLVKEAYQVFFFGLFGLSAGFLLGQAAWANYYVRQE